MHVLSNKRIARRVIQHREAPRISKYDKMRLARIKVDVDGFGACTELPNAGKGVDALT